MAIDPKQIEILNFLHDRIFDPILQSSKASNDLKSGVHLAVNRMERRSVEKVVQYYWSAVIGTERSIGFAERTRQAGFSLFDEVLGEFRVRFEDHFLRS